MRCLLLKAWVNGADAHAHGSLVMNIATFTAAVSNIYTMAAGALMWRARNRITWRPSSFPTDLASNRR
jgi:hypothetical protein